MVLHLGLWSLLTKLFLSCEIVHALKLIFLGGGEWRGAQGHPVLSRRWLSSLFFLHLVGFTPWQRSAALLLCGSVSGLSTLFQGSMWPSFPPGRIVSATVVVQEVWKSESDLSSPLYRWGSRPRPCADGSLTASAVFRRPMLRVWPLGSGVDWTLTYAFVSCVARGK